MKSISRLELKPGMVVAEDIRNYKGDLIVPVGTELRESHIAKIARHDIMVIPIKERIDYATTHFEKVRLSEGFQKFVEIYNREFAGYKDLLMNFVQYSQSFNIDDLTRTHDSIADAAGSPEQLLDYLYNMIPSEDNMTHAHCLNSALIAGVFGRWLGLSGGDREVLIQTGFVYDIGKVRIPDSILWKPGKLDDNEKKLIRQHTRMGYDLVKNLPLNVHIPIATLQHHERMNGSGYPDGVTGDRIDPFAKIIAIVDTYEAMTSARVYRQSLNPFQVIAQYEQNDGFVRYDGRALRTILSHIADTQKGMTVRLSDGRKAEVMNTNEHALSHPLVRLCDNSCLLDTAQFNLSIDAIY